MSTDGEVDADDCHNIIKPKNVCVHTTINLILLLLIMHCESN